MNTAQRRARKARARHATENADHARSRRLKRLRRARSLCFGLGLLLLLFAITSFHLPRQRDWHGHWMSLAEQIVDMLWQLPLSLLIACGMPELLGRCAFGVASLASFTAGLAVIRVLQREAAVGRTGGGAKK